MVKLLHLPVMSGTAMGNKITYHFKQKDEIELDESSIRDMINLLRQEADLLEKALIEALV